MSESKIARCRCGRYPTLRHERMATGHGEFPLFAWIECPCGMRTKSFIVDGFYGSVGTDEDVVCLWNNFMKVGMKNEN